MHETLLRLVHVLFVLELLYDALGVLDVFFALGQFLLLLFSILIFLCQNSLNLLIRFLNFSKHHISFLKIGTLDIFQFCFLIKLLLLSFQLLVEVLALLFFSFQLLSQGLSCLFCFLNLFFYFLNFLILLLKSTISSLDILIDSFYHLKYLLALLLALRDLRLELVLLILQDPQLELPVFKLGLVELLLQGEVLVEKSEVVLQALEF